MTHQLTLHSLIVGSLALSFGMLGLAWVNQILGRLAVRWRRGPSHGPDRQPVDTFRIPS